MLRKSLFGANFLVVNSQRHFFCQANSKHESPKILSDANHFKIKTRNTHLKEVQADTVFDVLVIGGGITGAGVFLESSRKGLKTLLIDSNDFSSGSSSKSTKLLHGGLRYLENAFKFRNKNRKQDFALVEEALNERNLLINTVPHLAKAVGIVIPTTNIFMCLFYYFGAVFYENFEKVYLIFNTKEEPFPTNLPFKFPQPQLMSREQMTTIFPNLSKSFKYGVLMYDGQIDDSRMVIETILTASSLEEPGIRSNNALNFVKLIEFKKNENGRINGAILEDKLTSKTFEVQTKIVINATGVLADKIRLSANPDLHPRMIASKGDHLTLDNSQGQLIRKMDQNIGLLIPKTKDGRLMFVLPWKNSVIAGTTDKLVKEPSIHASADPESVEQILNSVHEFFDVEDLKITSKWSGFRPLVKEAKNALDNQGANNSLEFDFNKELQQELQIQTKDIKRTHVIEVDDKSGLISIMGGKLTIFRLMGEDALKQVIAQLQLHHGTSQKQAEEMLGKSTRNLRFIGDFRNKFFEFRVNESAKNQEVVFKDRNEYLYSIESELIKGKVNLDSDVIKYLIENYGHRAILIRKKIELNPKMALRIDDKYPFTKAEIEHICEFEMVNSAAEILTNRLRLSFENAKETERILPVLVDVFGDFQGWNDEQKKEEYQFSLQLLKQLSF